MHASCHLLGAHGRSRSVCQRPRQKDTCANTEKAQYVFDCNVIQAKVVKTMRYGFEYSLGGSDRRLGADKWRHVVHEHDLHGAIKEPVRCPNNEHDKRSKMFTFVYSICCVVLTGRVATPRGACCCRRRCTRSRSAAWSVQRVLAAAHSAKQAGRGCSELAWVLAQAARHAPCSVSQRATV